MGGKKSTSTSSVSIPPEVLARYNAVNQRAETAAATPYEAFGKTASDYVAQMNAQQGAGINDINATAGSYQPYMTQATAATQAGMGPAYEGINNYMSPYIKNVADTTGAYMRQQAEQAQSGALGNAISSGAFGGDRAGIAAANLQQQNQMGYGKTMADIMNQGYTQALGASQADLSRQMQGGAQMAGLGAQSQQLGLQGAQAKIAAGTMQQQTEQAGKDAMINQFMQEKGYPFQTAQFLANIAMGTGTASGSTTSTTTPRNWMGFASGGTVEGYADGGGVAGPRSYSQQGIGGVGYVPAADLPVGQLMVADVPEDNSGAKTAEMIQMVASIMGAKNGGVIDQRHGYADGGTPSKWDMMLNDRPGVDSEFKALGRRALTTVLGATPFGANLGRVLPDLSTVATSQPVKTGVVPSNPVPAEAPAGGVDAGAITPAVTPATGVVAPTVAPVVTAPAPTGVVTPAAATPAVTPAGGVGGADVAADAMKTLNVTNVTPTSFDIPKTQPVTLGSETKPAAVDPIDFFNTKIIRQESGDNQFDSKGNPLTSSAGAVGVAQVMEGTGPEAAQLAGLEWDRNRWLNDKEYNKALGQAYFLEQYRKFGSLDKAAAAYNAGPGALASAMDRATALGGSYLDYLPAETQNYVHSTTGMGSAVDTGGLGGGRNVSGDGLAGADVTQRRGDPLNINKPYEDRNLIGKFFHDPTTGKLNPIAIKALLSGISGAAQARTISPLGGILAGIGAGNDTYNTLQNEEPKRVADIMANSKNARIQYLTEVAMGEQRPFEQWAVSKYGSGPASMFGSPDGGIASSQPMGRADILGSGLSQNITLPNGVVVQGGQNYAYLTKLANDLQPYVAAGVPAAIQTAATVEARLNDIRDSQGVVQDINGNDVKDPTYTSTLDTQTRTQFGRDKTLEFEGKAIEGQQRADRDLSMINHQVDVFTKFPAGALATDKAAGLAILQSLGVPVPADTSEYAAAAQEALKGAARKLLDSVGTDAPAAEMAQLQQAIESPNMEPAAVKTILSMQKAQAEREKQYYKLRPEWNAANPSMAMDQSAYEDWFTTAHPFEKYYQDAKAGMPLFAGELGSKQKPYALSPEQDENGNYSQADRDFENLPPGAYFKTPDGIIKQKPMG